MMKNWLSALFGSEARAIETVPRTCFALENSALQLVAGAARAGAGRVAGLRHEAVDHAVEHDAVVKPAPHQRLDLGAGVGRQIGPHLDDHPPERHVHVKRVFRVSRHRRASERQGYQERGGNPQNQPAPSCDHR